MTHTGLWAENKKGPIYRPVTIGNLQITEYAIIATQFSFMKNMDRSREADHGAIISDLWTQLSIYN
jgi:hypothetical protein